jgi:hypothetical protein
VLVGEVSVAKKAVDGRLSCCRKGLNVGVLLAEVEALGPEVVGKRAVGDGVVAPEGAAGGGLKDGVLLEEVNAIYL